MPRVPAEPTEPSCTLAPEPEPQAPTIARVCATHANPYTLMWRKQTHWLHTPLVPTYTLGTHRLAHNPDVCVYRCTQPWTNTCPTSWSQAHVNIKVHTPRSPDSQTTWTHIHTHTQLPGSKLAPTHTPTQRHTIPEGNRRTHPRHVQGSSPSCVLQRLAAGNTTAERNVLILKFVFNQAAMTAKGDTQIHVRTDVK